MTSPSEAKKVFGINHNLGAWDDLTHGQVIERNGMTWEMTPEACLRGDHDGCIWRAIYRWRALGCGDHIENDDALQTCRIYVAQYVRGYDEEKGSPSTFLCNYAFYALARMQSHAPQVERPVSTGAPPGLVSVNELEAEYGSDIAHQMAGLVQGSLEERVIGAVDAERIISRWSGLTDRERHVIERRIVDEATLCEIGQEIGVCRERVRQIFEAAMDDVRSSVRKRTGLSVVVKKQRTGGRRRRQGGNVPLRIRLKTYHTVHQQHVTIDSLERAYGVAHTTAWHSVRRYVDSGGAVEERRVKRLGKSAMCIVDVAHYLEWEAGREC